MMLSVMICLNLRHVKSHHSFIIIRTSKCLSGRLLVGLWPRVGIVWYSARRVGFCACVNAIQDSSIGYALDNRSVAHVSFGNYLTLWVLNLQRMPVGILRLVSGFDHWIKTTFGSFTAWFVKIATLIEGILLIVSFHLFLLFCFFVLFSVCDSCLWG